MSGTIEPHNRRAYHRRLDGGKSTRMAHTIRDKEGLVHRVHRLRGQVDAIEKALDQERECAEILQTIAACRGAMNALMAELVEEQIRAHLLQPDRRKPTAGQRTAAEGLIRIVRTYLR